MEDFLQAQSINKYAIIVNPNDNVAVVKREVGAGDIMEMADGRTLRAAQVVQPGHRLATKPIPPGQFVLQYGQPIGTSLGIAEGDPVSHANMSDDIPTRRDLPEDLHNAPPDLLSDRDIPASWAIAGRIAGSARATTFSSYRRACARVMKRSRSRR